MTNEAIMAASSGSASASSNAGCVIALRGILESCASPRVSKPAQTDDNTWHDSRVRKQ